MSTLKSRIAGAIYGMAVGDALGATTEFMTKEQIKLKYGVLEDIVGGGWLGLKAGEVTDDTQMSICVMDSLMSMKCPYDKVGFFSGCIKNFIDWYKSCPPDIGGQCGRSIRRLIARMDIPEEPDALGNGGLMRAVPCAVLCRTDLNLIQSKLTHNNETCSNAIIIYSNTLNELIRQNIKFEGYKKLKYDEPMEPTGCVSNTLYNALYYLGNSCDFEESMIQVVNDGGDADTIGCVAGGLLGAKFGYEDIPLRWINKLNEETRKKLDEFIDFCVKTIDNEQ